MRNKNNVKQFGRTSSHRKMMFNNMVTSLFDHERIVTTKEKGKELKRISEKLITRAKKNLNVPDSEKRKKLHNKRVVMKVIKDRTVVAKLFDKIAPRFKDRKGGYTRLYLLGRRPGDAAEMAIVELVEREVTEKKTTESVEKDKKEAKVSKKDKKEKKEKVEAKKDKDSKKAKEAKETKKTKKVKETKDKDVKETKDKKEKKETKKTADAKKEKKEAKKTVVMTKEKKEKSKDKDKKDKKK